jgi:hypothetical protein
LRILILLVSFILVGSCHETRVKTNRSPILFSMALPKMIDETSGLEFWDKAFITHNDSGDEARLYRFSSEGKLLEVITIPDAQNNDWEDLAKDQNYFYIADSGNNKGNRKNLSILIVDPQNDFQKMGEIRFRYAAQQNFNKRNQHPFDAEALIATADVLLLFSKNRDNLSTQLYSLPKTPGEYSLSPLISLEVESLITGADYRADLQLVALVGYNAATEQFLYTLNHFDLNHLEGISLKKIKLPLDGKQIEAIKIIDQNSFWITSENEGNSNPMLYKIKI